MCDLQKKAFEIYLSNSFVAHFQFAIGFSLNQNTVIFCWVISLENINYSIFSTLIEQCQSNNNLVVTF